ncbi:MAG: sensor histidine kinase, partial [Acidobacteria bacterium]|nr:sensor histidine kinase [Acidobacteriota bacterium]
LFELEQWNIPAIREMLQAATMNKEGTKTIELDHLFPRIGRKTMRFHATPLFRSGVRVHKVLVVIEDMTEQREAEAALRRNEQKLREVAAQQIGLLEKENQKVSMMLHDSFSQKLALLMIALERLQRQLPADPDIVKQELRKLAEEVSGLDREIHQLAQEVYPALLRELGLEMALKKECEAFRERYGITIRLASVAIPELPPEAALCLFRIAQESMLNIAKHAGVKEGTITLTANDRSVMLTVEDMGKGYDVEEARGKTGLGLIGMEERARLLGCKLSVQSKPGSGTRIVVEVPLKREATEAMQRSDKG